MAQLELLRLRVTAPSIAFFAPVRVVEGQAEPSSGTQRGDSMAPPWKRKKQPTITEHGDLDGGDHSRGLARPRVLRFCGEKQGGS